VELLPTATAFAALLAIAQTGEHQISRGFLGRAAAGSDPTGHGTHRTRRPDGTGADPPMGPMGPMPDAIDGADVPSGAETAISAPPAIFFYDLAAIGATIQPAQHQTVRPKAAGHAGSLKFRVPDPRKSRRRSVICVKTVCGCSRGVLLAEPTVRRS
jgi:hypothetical protein